MNLADNRWDHDFRLASVQYLPDLDWRWLKAQCYQESRYNNRAVSPAGAQGLMQIMPATWRMLVEREKIPPTADPFCGRDSIHAGAIYLAMCRKTWWWQRPEIDRLALALASYNAGSGHLLTAQRNQGDPSDYAGIIAGLPAVTGDHSKETIAYVRRIFTYFRQLVVGS